MWQGLWPRFTSIKIAEVECWIYCTIFGSTVSTVSKLPLEWISANIVPVYKKGDKHLTSN